MRRRLLALGFAALAATALHAQPPAPRGFPAQRPPNGPSAGPRPLLFGFALDCTRCRFAPGDDDPALVWHYTDFPHVAAVKPGGAAAAAGVQEGDTIVLVDGMSILSAEGARRFSRVRPGESVRLTVHRGGRSVDATIALRRPPDAAPPPPSPAARRRRYSGEVGGAAVDVWSQVPLDVFVDSTGALTVQTGTSTIRIVPRKP